MYVYNYLICAIAQIVFASIVWKSAYMDTRRNKLFCLGVLCNMLTLLGYAGRGITNDGNHFWLNFFDNYVLYIAATLSAFLFLLTSIKRNGILYKITFVLEILILLYIVTTPWTHWAFYIDENGLYQRGVLYVIMFGSHGLFSLIWIGVLAVTYRNVEFKKRIYVLLLGVFELVAIILETLAIEFKVIHVAFAFLIDIYYVFMMEVEGRYDQMTGVYSKRFYYPEIDRLPSNGSYIVFVLDANGLKYINDNMGHEYGDLAIKAVGHSAWEIMHSKAKVFRTGGDEFVGFSTLVEEDEMPKYIEKINARLIEESKKLGFDVAASIGYAVHIDGEDFQSTLHRADENMFKAKNEYYEKTGKKRRV